MSLRVLITDEYPPSRRYPRGRFVSRGCAPPAHFDAGDGLLVRMVYHAHGPRYYRRRPRRMTGK